MYRFHPQTHKVRELVVEGAIGELRFIQCNFGFTLIADPDIRREPEKGGGSLWDIGSYPVSFSRAVVGDNPVEVTGWQVQSPKGVDMDFGGQLRFASGPLAQFTSSFQTVPHWEAKLIGSQGTIHLDLPWLNRVGATARVLVLRGGGAEQETFGDGTEHLDIEEYSYESCDAYFCEVEAMAASILDGAPTTITPEDSRGNVATLVALYASARESRVVAL
jgi:predicted dehydrogenase